MKEEDQTGVDDGYETCSIGSAPASAVEEEEERDVRMLAHLLGGIEVDMPRDFDAIFENMPEWIDPVKLKRGQRFALDYYFGVSFSEVVSLYVLFALSKNGLETLIRTNRSNTPYRAYRRYYETSEIVRTWLETDILEPGTEGYENLRKVFRMHRQIRDDKFRNPSKYETAQRSPGTTDGRCSYLLPDLRKDFVRVPPGCVEMFAHTEQHDLNSFSQCYLAITQFGFFGLALVYPEWFGIHNCSRRDMEDFVHLWRTIGYFMGLSDEYNFGRGTLDEVIDRSRWLVRAMVKPKFRDLTTKWEHMSRCVADGLRMYMPSSMPFDTSFCYLCDVFDLDVTNFKKTIGFWQQVSVWWTRFFMKYLMRFDCVRRTMNMYVFGCLKRATVEFNDETVQARLKDKVFDYCS
ncbi:Hypothetical protein CINCED_3A004619 [Cinara cedri]|nr:Hypothetical protein CINCED_3A004619 [Cinara cedri]